MTDPASPSVPPAIDYATARAQWESVENALQPFRRVARVATFDAWTIAIFAAPTFICGLFGGITGVLLGGAMSIIAYVEFTSAAKLRRLDLTALDRLAVNQLALAGVLVVYAAWSLYALHGHGLLATAQQDMPELGLGATGSQLGDAMGSQMADLDKTLSLALYGGLVVIAVFAQGGMALYYRSRRRRLQQILSTLPPAVIDAQRGTHVKQTQSQRK